MQLPPLISSPCTPAENELADLFSKEPFSHTFNRHAAADHFMICPRTAKSTGDICHRFKFPTITYEDPFTSRRRENERSVSQDDPWGNVIKLAKENGDISVPHPSWVHREGSGHISALASQHSNVQHNDSRPLLAVYAGSLMEDRTSFFLASVIGLRKVFQEACHSVTRDDPPFFRWQTASGALELTYRSDQRCLVYGFQRSELQVGVLGSFFLSEQQSAEVAFLYGRSVFCLQPPGDMPTRKGQEFTIRMR